MENHDSSDDEFPWHFGVFDAHCHAGNTAESINHIPSMKAKALAVMASRAQDQHVVAQFAESHGFTHGAISALFQNEDKKDIRCQIVPSFGWHPWYSHLLYDDSLNMSEKCLQGADKTRHYNDVITPKPIDNEFILSLPDPQPLSAYLRQTRKYLEKFPYALVGEIGLDSSFRIPDHRSLPIECEKYSGFTPGGRQGRRLTSYRVCMNHQRAILNEQLKLAAELSRPVSVHGVAAHGALFEALRETWNGHEIKAISKRSKRKLSRGADLLVNEDQARVADQVSVSEANAKPFPPRICLHSYSGHSDLLKQYFHPSVPAVMFFSFSQLVNFSTPSSSKAVDVIKAVPDDRILVESDLHCAGQRMDYLLKEIVQSICHIRNWPLEEGVKQLALNWLTFVFGENHQQTS